MRIPFLDLPLQYRSLQSAIDAALERVIDRGTFIGGEEVETFEESFARSLGIDHCIGVGNGTDALFLSLKALGVGPGDRVITAANSFIASAEAITMTGASPLFIDCDPGTYLINLDHVERALVKSRRESPVIKAIIPVHLYGRAVDMSRLMQLASQYHVPVVEDCAQAHFAKWKGQYVGTFGDLGCFSFYPGKNLGAYGDAGAIVTRHGDLADTLRKWHDHGRVLKFAHEFPGVNSRLDTIQAAVLNVKLPQVLEWNARRRQHARQYQESLASVVGITLPADPGDDSHVFHLYVIRSKSREALRQTLQEKGIDTGVHYPVAIPNTRAYHASSGGPDEYPVASAYQEEVLSLPMFSELTSEQIDYVAEVVKQAAATGAR